MAQAISFVIIIQIILNYFKSLVKSWALMQNTITCFHLFFTCNVLCPSIQGHAHPSCLTQCLLQIFAWFSSESPYRQVILDILNITPKEFCTYYHKIDYLFGNYFLLCLSWFSCWYQPGTESMTAHSEYPLSEMLWTKSISDFRFFNPKISWGINPSINTRFTYVSYTLCT